MTRSDPILTIDGGLGRLHALAAADRWDEAEALGRRIVDAVPDFIVANLLLAEIFEKRGRIAAAVALYDRVIALVPGYALPFTRRARLLLRQAWGPPPAARVTPPDAGRVAMTSLGANGRFGNQLLQYGFLRLYAHAHGLVAEAPDWIGRDLFDLDDPPPGPALPRLDEEAADLPALLQTPGAAPRDVDLHGYFAGPTGRIAPFRALWRSLFRPGRKAAAAARAIEAALDAQGETLVALHLRRGDFGYGRFWIAPADWYLAWLETVWPTLPRPVLYLASDDPAAAATFARFAPVTAADVGVEVPGAEFFVDFHALRHAQLLAISNSSFSFTASLLAERVSATVRPDPAAVGLVPYDPWDAEVLL